MGDSASTANGGAHGDHAGTAHQAMPDPGKHGGHAAGGHDRHAGHSVAMFRDKFWLSLALTIPVVVWSPDIQAWFGYTVAGLPRLRRTSRRSSARSSSCTAAWSSSAAPRASWPTGSPG